MNQIGLPTYLINDKEYLIVYNAEIKGGHGPLLESKYILYQFQSVVKAVKFCCGDNYIINKITPLLLLPIVKHANEIYIEQ